VRRPLRVLGRSTPRDAAAAPCIALASPGCGGSDALLATGRASEARPHPWPWRQRADLEAGASIRCRRHRSPDEGCPCPSILIPPPRPSPPPQSAARPPRHEASPPFFFSREYDATRGATWPDGGEEQVRSRCSEVQNRRRRARLLWRGRRGASTAAARPARIVCLPATTSIRHARSIRRDGRYAIHAVRHGAALVCAAPVRAQHEGHSGADAGGAPWTPPVSSLRGTADRVFCAIRRGQGCVTGLRGRRHAPCLLLACSCLCRRAPLVTRTGRTASSPPPAPAPVPAP
jgi:hypothetical protein